MRLSDVTVLELLGDIAVIRTDSPPVNALAAPVRAGLLEGLRLAEADPAVRGIVVACAGRTFHAGADISELSKGPISPTLNDVLHALDHCPKLVVAALHGTTLGGGLELALAAHYRIAADNSSCGLPEVLLGLIPGAGGTQRLPRAAGVAAAIDLITTGRQAKASEALRLGIVDRLVPAEGLETSAIEWARSLLADGAPQRRLSDTPPPGTSEAAQAVIDAFAATHAKKFARLLAPNAALRAVKAAWDRPFAEGQAAERAEFITLLADSQSRALRHLFFAERAIAKSKWIPKEAVVRPLQRIGVIGAGTMGGGIAMNFLNVGHPVQLVEMNTEALERGMSVIRRNYEATAAKGKLSAGAVTTRLGLLSASTDLTSLADCDLVIEAIYENMDAKLDLFARLGAIAKPAAVLATNTSYLDVERMAQASGRPDQVLGLHFFSPANVNRLLEVIRTASVAPDTLATGMAIAKRIGKVGILVGNVHGFVGNRMLAHRQREADKLILEGALPWDVDRVLETFGLPMGPFRMRDLAGMDIGWNRTGSTSATVREIFCEMGRMGQKSQSGYYDYDAQRRATPSPLAEQVVLEFAAKHGYTRRPVSDQEILERCLYPMINEGAHILAEGIAERSSDIDILWTTGYGWPIWTGGPMHWAQEVGLQLIVERLRHYESLHGAEFTPSDALIQMAQATAR
jgi:3-hydroxyacyl-CoA dehydrogenase